MIIEFQNVTKKFGNIKALDDVSFKVDEGEFVFIIGSSGAGKSTLTKLLLKEVNPTSGKILFFDKDITKVPNRKIPKIRQDVGVVFQDFRLLENMTVYRNIEYALDILGLSKSVKRERIKKVLDLVGLEARKNAYPNELSGGEQQRVCIARAMSIEPDVLIADEPTGNLDPATSMAIAEDLKKINDQGTTIVMVTHEKELVDYLKKRVIKLSKGKIVSDVENGVYDVDN